MRGARLLVVGVAYKPGVRDVREFPGIEIVIELLRGTREDYYDPPMTSIHIDDGPIMLSVAEPDPTIYDAVVLSTMHANADYSWLADAALVYDPAGRYNMGHSRANPSPQPSDVQLAVEEGFHITERSRALRISG